MNDRDREELVDALNELLADMFVYRAKLQAYHWTVTGDLFYPIHNLTQELYESLNEPIDELGEVIRSLNGTPIISVEEFASESNLTEPNEDATAREMIQELTHDNEIIIGTIAEAEELGESKSVAAEGVMDFLNARHAEHESTFRYKLESHLK